MSKASQDIAATVNFFSRQGTTFNKDFIVTHANGSDYDLTGYSFVYKIYDPRGRVAMAAYGCMILYKGNFMGLQTRKVTIYM